MRADRPEYGHLKLHFGVNMGLEGHFRAENNLGGLKINGGRVIPVLLLVTRLTELWL